MKREESKTVGEIVRDRPLYVAQKGDSVLTAVLYMVEHRIGAVPVLEGGRLVGIFSERDVLTRVVAQGLDPASVQVAQVMTEKPMTIEKDITYNQALAIMEHFHVRHLPVMDAGRLIGCVSIRELGVIEIKDKESEIAFMEDYIRKIESVM